MGLAVRRTFLATQQQQQQFIHLLYNGSGGAATGLWLMIALSVPLAAIQVWQHAATILLLREPWVMGVTFDERESKRETNDWRNRTEGIPPTRLILATPLQRMHHRTTARRKRLYYWVTSEQIL